MHRLLLQAALKILSGQKQTFYPIKPKNIVAAGRYMMAKLWRAFRKLGMAKRIFDLGSLTASVSSVLLSVEAVADVANKLTVISMIKQADKRLIIVIRF